MGSGQDKTFSFLHGRLNVPAPTSSGSMRLVRDLLILARKPAFGGTGG